MLNCKHSFANCHDLWRIASHKDLLFSVFLGYIPIITRISIFAIDPAHHIQLSVKIIFAEYFADGRYDCQKNIRSTRRNFLRRHCQDNFLFCDILWLMPLSLSVDWYFLCWYCQPWYECSIRSVLYAERRTKVLSKHKYTLLYVLSATIISW